MIASIWGDVQAVSLLLQQKDIDVDSMDDEGETPISLAIKSGYEGVQKLLLDAGAHTSRNAVSNLRSGGNER